MKPQTPRERQASIVTALYEAAMTGSLDLCLPKKAGKCRGKDGGLRTYMAAMIISFFSFLSFALSLLGETGGKGVNEVANKAATDVEKRDSVKQNLMVELERIRLTLTEDRDHGAENQTWCRY